MERILSSQLSAYAGSRVQIAGWTHRRRMFKSVSFLIVRDRAGLAQVVVPEGRNLEGFGEETVVSVVGSVTANPAAPGGFELTEPVIEVLSEPVAGLPVELHRPELSAALPTLLDNAAVTLRHGTRRPVFALSAAAIRGFRAVLDERGFTEVTTPKIVGTATESGANVFSLDYFGRKAYLAQSPQFYKQTMVGVFERVYEIGPVFRAEPHDTARHLAEYVSLDLELGFIRDHREVMAVLRDVLAGMVAEAAGPASELGLKLPEVLSEIPAVHFTEALRIAGDEPTAGDLSPSAERAVGEWAQREHGSDFVFVEGYPSAKRPFYTHPDPARPGYTNGFDLLFRGLELVTGGQRLHRYGDYLRALAERGESAAEYADYLQAFKYGMPPHGGFAIGLERFVMQLTGAANVREVTLFPRDLNRVTP
ncbi:MAG: aspartate--tRNA(Asn) ligase [Longispora sp.]|nr:aspartate--tRNA(Asn) ligase [Longispora sp. (in: high G+C Gram-positive bacteria)]